MRVITAGALTLEPQVAAHAPAMFDVLADPALYAYEHAAPASRAWLEERFRRLESRQSADGSEQWLNWVIRLRSGELIGYVQGTIYADGSAAVAYVLGSAHWGRGLATGAVRAMLEELADHYQVHTFMAVLKAANVRSRRLLEKLGFRPADAALAAAHRLDPGECLMLRGADDVAR